MNRNLVGSIYGRFSIKIAHFIPIRLQTWLPQAILVSDWSTIYYNREVFLRNEPIRNKSCLWWPCLLTDRDEMSKLYRGPSIDASNQVSVHLTKRFRRRRSFKSPIRNKNCLWRPCLLIDRDKMSNL